MFDVRELASLLLSPNIRATKIVMPVFRLTIPWELRKKVWNAASSNIERPTIRPGEAEKER